MATIGSCLKFALLSVFFLVGLFAAGIAVPFLRPFVDLALAPGYLIPEAYWGGVHDPLQIAAANLLNVVIYSSLFALLAGLRRRAAGQRRIA